MANAQPNIWKWDNFRGGLSNDPFVGKDGTFQSGKNIDNRQNPRGITLAPKVKDSGGTFTGKVMGLLNLENYGGSGVIAYTNDAKVYKFDLGTNTWSLVVNLSTTTDTDKTIYNAESVSISAGARAGQNIVFFTKTKIHACKIDFSSVAIDWQSYTGTTTIARPVFKISGFLIFGADNSLYNMDLANNGIIDIGSSAIASLDDNEIAIGITRAYDMLRVYSTTTSSAYASKGRQSFFSTSGLNKGVHYVIDWNNLPIKAVSNEGPNDFVITGANQYYSALYLSNGQSRTLLKRWKEGSGNGFIPTITTFKGMCMVAGTDNIYTHGTINPDIDLSILPEYNLGVSANIAAFLVLTDKIFVAYDYGTTYKVGIIDKNAVPNIYGYADSGEIVSQVFNGGNFFPEKKISNIIIEADTSIGNNHQGQIVVYARTSPDASWQTIATVGVQDTRNTRITGDALNAINLLDFSQLEIKAVITPHNNGTINDQSPIFYGTQVYFEYIRI